MSEGTALLLSWLRYGEKDLEPRYVPRALEALARLEADWVTLTASSRPGDVLDILSLVAATIQTELPEELGLATYVALLQPLPPHVLKLAALEILRTHAYRSMPLPSEFIGSDAVREWKATLTWMPAQLARWRRRLQENSN